MLSRTHHGRGGFVARAFDAEDVGVGHEAIVFEYLLRIAQHVKTRESRESHSQPLGSGDSRGFDSIAGTHFADRFGKIISHRAFGEAEFGGDISAWHNFAALAQTCVRVRRSVLRDRIAGPSAAAACDEVTCSHGAHTTKSWATCWLRLEQSQPLVLAILEASTRLLAPILLIASER